MRVKKCVWLVCARACVCFHARVAAIAPRARCVRACECVTRVCFAVARCACPHARARVCVSTWRVCARVNVRVRHERVIMHVCTFNAGYFYNFT